MKYLLILSVIYFSVAGCAEHSLNRAERELILQGEPHHNMAVFKNDRPDQDKILRRKSKPIRYDDPMLPLFAARLRITMDVEGGVGIAAPQVGINRRLILVRYPLISPKPTVTLFLNPRIIGQSDEIIIDWEGCMSIPAGFGQVRRPQWIEIAYTDAHGKEQKLHATGFQARIILHEMDHLDGILFIDKREQERLLTRKEYEVIRAKRLEKLHQEAQTAPSTKQTAE
jgi:peptide deformylase